MSRGVRNVVGGVLVAVLVVGFVAVRWHYFLNAGVAKGAFDDINLDTLLVRHAPDDAEITREPHTNLTRWTKWPGTWARGSTRWTGLTDPDVVARAMLEDVAQILGKRGWTTGPIEQGHLTGMHERLSEMTERLAPGHGPLPMGTYALEMPIRHDAGTAHGDVVVELRGHGEFVDVSIVLKSRLNQFPW